ncbi:MAG: NAD(P)-dependent oxidoreductase [Candidatus Methylomirabilales bacterium]
MGQTVGLVGAGIMGSRMCRNLLKAGFPVLAFDRSPEALRVVGEAGATPVADLAAVGRGAPIVLMSLPDPAAVLDVVEGEGGLLAHLPAGAYLCDLSTLDPGTSRRVHASAQAHGIQALDCPVSGGPQGAEAATLTIMVGGDAADLDAVRPVLSAVGRKIVHCGGPGTGQAAKLVNQAMVAVNTVAALEALLVGRKAGLSLDTMFSILQGSSGRSWMLENHVRTQALSGNFEPGFAMDLMFKDLRLFVESAMESKAAALVAGTALQLYSGARAAGLGALDQTAVVKELERLAGVELGKLGPEA